MIYQTLGNPIIVPWDIVKCFLPQRWRQRSKKLPGIGKKASTTRCDEFLQLAIIHLGNNLSIKDTMRAGRSLKLRSFTPTKFLKCLESSGEWFQWMASEFAARHLGRQIPSLQGERGKQFLLHTSIVQGKSIPEVKKLIQFTVDINSLECSFLTSNPPKGCQISWFPISRNSVYIGNWQLKNREMIDYITKNKGACHNQHSPFPTRVGIF